MHYAQHVADRRAARLNCGEGKFVGCAIQKKREFFQVRRLPADKAFPWPIGHPQLPRKSLGAEVFQGSMGDGNHPWKAVMRGAAAAQGVLHRGQEGDEARELSSVPDSRTLQAKVPPELETSSGAQCGAAQRTWLSDPGLPFICAPAEETGG